MVFQYGQDSNKICSSYLPPCKFEKGDIKYNKAKKEDVFDFVGFIITEQVFLSVFPKKFYADNTLEYLNTNEIKNSADIKLLFDVFIRYITEQNSTAKANRHLGSHPEFVSDYPFASFFQIYDYFAKYGVYYENEVKIKPNASGDISWKKTIQKSQVIISDGNLIFSPLYRKKIKSNNVFLSECMAYVIDHTVDSFPFFISLPKTRFKLSGFDFIKHRDFTIQRLIQVKSQAFKDSEQKLITNLIAFFEQYKSISKGGAIHVKITYFDRVWERMVQKYLNDNFSHVDNIGNEVACNGNPTVQFGTKEIKVDASPHKYSIRLDHFAEDDNYLYIFDSKYYNDIDELNYKQFSYNEFLRGISIGKLDIYSALILPDYTDHSQLHFEMEHSLTGARKIGLKIIEQYFDVKKVMQNYLK